MYRTRTISTSGSVASIGSTAEHSNASSTGLAADWVADLSSVVTKWFAEIEIPFYLRIYRKASTFSNYPRNRLIRRRAIRK